MFSYWFVVTFILFFMIGIGLYVLIIYLHTKPLPTKNIDSSKLMGLWQKKIKEDLKRRHTD